MFIAWSDLTYITSTYPNPSERKRRWLELDMRRLAIFGAYGLVITGRSEFVTSSVLYQ